MAWLNFDHAQSNSEKMAQRLKRLYCPKWFFLLKNNKMFMYLLAPFILQNFKKIHNLIQGYKDVPFSGPKWSNVLNKIFLVQTIIITFIYLLVQNGPMSWTKFFWYKLLLLLSSNYWAFSLCEIQKDSYSTSRVMSMHHFWAQNGLFAPIFWGGNY